jgi:hypothetical protein
MSAKNIIHAGLDVDDSAFHGAGIIRETGEIFGFKCKPDHGVLRILPGSGIEQKPLVLRYVKLTLKCYWHTILVS